MKRLYWFGAYLIFLSLCACERLDFSHLDKAVVDAKVAAEMSSGTAYVVVKDGAIVHEGYFGYADIEAGRLIDRDSVFYLASTTKAIMGLTILLAEERGDVSLDTTLDALFPQLDFTHVDAELITVRHLLTHTSGVKNDILTWAASYTGLHDADTRRDMIATLQPNHTYPLGHFSYSNIGYNILAIWLDGHYGRDWRHTVQEFVFKPLNMQHTSGFISEGIARDWPIALPYSHKFEHGAKPVTLRKHDATMYAVGAIGTARDAARFVLAHMQDGTIDNKTVFSRRVIETQREKQVAVDGGYFDGYALGWMTRKHRQHQVRFHTGGFVGASALLSYLPEEDIGVVVLHNESGFKANHLNSIIEEAVYDRLLGVADKHVASKVNSAATRLSERAATEREKLRSERLELNTRPWQLTLPEAHYNGVYKHPKAGPINVDYQDDNKVFALTWGFLQANAFPGQEPDSLTADFRPGTYQTIKFITQNKGVISAEINGLKFDKQ